jgi:cell division protein FtsX
MFPLSAVPSLAKYIGVALVVILLGSIGYFSVHTYTTTVQQNGQLQATNVTLKADSAKASSATEVAVKKLQQFDTIIQKKATNEQHLQQDAAQFVSERKQLGVQSVAVDAWATAPVPAAVISSLCERTAIRSSDCHRDQDSPNPASTDLPH